MPKVLQALAALLTISLVLANPVAGAKASPQHAGPQTVHLRGARHHKKRRTIPCGKQKDPLPCIATRHGWDAYQQQDWRDVIHCESDGGCSDTSSVVQYNLTIKNSGGCYGVAQFSGGASEYYAYGGDPYTVYGQLTAMGRYIQGRYGTPSAALQSEHDYHSY